MHEDVGVGTAGADHRVRTDGPAAHGVPFGAPKGSMQGPVRPENGVPHSHRVPSSRTAAVKSPPAETERQCVPGRMAVGASTSAATPMPT